MFASAKHAICSTKLTFVPYVKNKFKQSKSVKRNNPSYEFMCQIEESKVKRNKIFCGRKKLRIDLASLTIQREQLKGQYHFNVGKNDPSVPPYLRRKIEF